MKIAINKLKPINSKLIAKRYTHTPCNHSICTKKLYFNGKIYSFTEHNAEHSTKPFDPNRQLTVMDASDRVDAMEIVLVYRTELSINSYRFVRSAIY